MVQPIPLFKLGAVVYSESRDDHGHVVGFDRNDIGELVIVVHWSKSPNVNSQTHIANVRVYE